MEGQKTGGRRAGTPNKATATLKGFLDGVFVEAFADPTFRACLLAQIVTLSIDTTLLRTLLAHWAGSPSQAVDHTHTGRVTLEQIVAGTVPKDDPEDEQT